MGQILSGSNIKTSFRCSKSFGQSMKLQKKHCALEYRGTVFRPLEWFAFSQKALIEEHKGKDCKKVHRLPFSPRDTSLSSTPAMICIKLWEAPRNMSSTASLEIIFFQKGGSFSFHIVPLPDINILSLS